MTTTALEFSRCLPRLVAASRLIGSRRAVRGAISGEADPALLPFPAGGAVDIVARARDRRMAEDLGKPFVIENKAGAGGIIATDATAKAAPDGYTLLLTTPNHTINAALNAKLPYDTEKDLAPVSIVAEVPEVLVSHPAAPFTDFQDFVDYAKANPGKLNYASAGNGTLPHVTMELLLRRTGIAVAHIPYRGAAPAMTDLLAGQCSSRWTPMPPPTSRSRQASCAMLAYREPRAIAADAGRADRRRNGPARLRGHPVDRHGGAGRHAEAGDREACGGDAARGALARPAERLKSDGVDPVGGTPERIRAR